jgi:predicted ATPase
VKLLRVIDAIHLLRRRLLARSERNDESWCVAELLRIKAELILREGAPQAATAAEEHFLRALDWARRQGALSWELRTSTSLARLLHDQGHIAEARSLLQPVYDRFNEGFETADLKSEGASRLLAVAHPDAADARLRVFGMLRKPAS